MPPASTPEPRTAPKPPTKRTRQVAGHLKSYIVEQGLRPGDRLPGEAELMQLLDRSKGTVREAMRILEAEGLLRTRTGPGGGVFVSDVPEPRAAGLLANYFYFRDLSIDDLYQIRIQLEPELAAAVAGRLDAATIARFRAAAHAFDQPPATPEEERAQHVASLDFHRELAAQCDNPLLSFLVRFVAQMLSYVTVTRHLYLPHNRELWERGQEYHARLLDALEAGEAEAARAVMRAHMETALVLMRRQESQMSKRFLDRLDV